MGERDGKDGRDVGYVGYYGVEVGKGGVEVE